MNVYVVKENGQLEINFEVLLLKTSSEFTSRIKSLIKNEAIQPLVNVKDYSSTLELWFADEYTITIYKYSKLNSSIHYMSFGQNDVQEMRGLIL